LPRAIPVALLVAAAVLAPGCSVVAHAIWPCPPAVSRDPGTRETPDAALALMIAAFRDGRRGDIYGSFHPAFVEEQGGFSQEEFSLAYEQYLEDFAADAKTLAAADRTSRPARDGIVVVDLDDPASGAHVSIAFANRPKIRVFTTNEFVGPIEGTVDMHAMVGLAGGRLTLPAEFDLTTLENVEPEMVAALKSEDVVRVEFSDDWLVRSIDIEHARNIRFLDKLKELRER
jgi:hypothetical protein